jgi:hypothetical protein
MALHIDTSKVAAATETKQTFMGPPADMEAMVNQATFVWPNWVYTAGAIERMHPTTFLLGFSAVQTGIPEITKSNWPEAYVRLAMVEAVYGAFRVDEEKNPFPITVEEVKAHIGLRVNVAPKTSAEFNREMAQRLREKATRALAKETSPA